MAAQRRESEELISASWLGSSLGVDPTRLQMLRRDGRVLAVRPPGAREDMYPTWQFDEGGRPRPEVERVIRAAKARGIGEQRLWQLMSARVGLGGERRLADLLREGKVDFVVQTIRSAQA